ncbi:MAG: DivIVA domain-containing protein [Deltaproteobacteria bacterium]|jgi:cell division initiation protein|nr:DivIVA domain-containing protein [Deltaproteobacteria bacterium]
MKITPLDIQQQQFRVRFRGFDMVEVDNFLDLAANEFEELLRENNRLKEEDRQKAEKIQELERAERDLRNALISAQQICEEMKNQARKEGELIIEEAKDNARKVLQTAQGQAMQVETEITRLQRQRAEFEASLKSILEMHLSLLDTHPENRSFPPPDRAE